MTKYERAAQAWSVLVLAARNQKVLSYDTLGRLGIPRQGVGRTALGPILHYCKQHGLPPLTSIVVEDKTGLPSYGFIAEELTPENIFKAQTRVFVHDWLGKKPPTGADFKKADSKYHAQVGN